MINKNAKLFGAVSPGQVGGGTGQDSMKKLFSTRKTYGSEPIAVDASGIGTNCYGFRAGYTVSLDTNVVIIDTQAFRGQMFLEDITGMGVSEVYTEAFSVCSGLKTVNFPWLTNVGNGAFRDSGLEAVDMPRVTSAGSGAFRRCYSLASAKFAQLATLGETMLAECHKLTDVYLGYDGVVGLAQVETEPDVYEYDNPLADSGNDAEGPYTITVHVPSAQLSAYQADPGWQSVVSKCADDYMVDVVFEGDYED